MNEHGFVRVTAASPVVKVADPAANVDAMLEVLDKHPDSDVVVFPELSITGYSCGDLFGQQTLLDAAERELKRLVNSTRSKPGVVFVGLPVRRGNSLFNAVAAIGDGRVSGIVPKSSLPTYHEYYESRRFTAWRRDEHDECSYFVVAGVPGTYCDPDILFSVDPRSGQSEVEGRPRDDDRPFEADGPLFDRGRTTIGVEICEELWTPSPPSGVLAQRGANILINASASTEQVGKSDYRRQLVSLQSARCVAGYVYAGAGPAESTTDIVFGGHVIIAENGSVLAEGRTLDGNEQSTTCTADIDVASLNHERLERSTFGSLPKSADVELLPQTIRFGVGESNTLLRRVPAHPFVPADPATKAEHCEEIFAIQTHALAKRLGRLGENWSAFVGVSGGLDSTLALLVAAKTCDLLEVPRSRITGVTMPGFGTTARTRSQADDLMEHLGVMAETVDIRGLCLKTFRDLGHKPFGLDPSMSVEEFQKALAGVPVAERSDLTFENVQARVRTLILMSKGFVIGTGDMSEAALGWSTYNADHMSMYNPNCSVPKTLVRHLVAYVAEAEFDGPARETLKAVCDTPVSPELLPPGADGEIAQSTEATLGPYELHDFFLYHMIRHGATPRKILFLAGHADFDGDYTPEFIRATLKTFYTRFFASQYKRSCVPDGPKVGSVSLSPRGDWRMPSDADVTAWIRELDA
ncbi:MAG: NAD(+) synthase [Planctomycetota bacterium]